MSRIVYLPDYSTVNAPDNMSDEQAISIARERFPEAFVAATPIAPPKPKPEPGIASEIGSILKSGTGQGIASLGKLGQYAGIGGKGLEEYGTGMTQRATEALSPGTQASLQRQFIKEAPEGQGFFGYQLGDAGIKDIPAQALQSIPMMAGTMAAAAGATTLAPGTAVAGVGAGFLSLLGRVGLGNVAGRIATAAGTKAGAAELLAGKLAINTLAGNVGEGLAAAGSSGIETEKAIHDFAQSDPDSFFQSPIGQQALKDADGDKKKAIELGAFRAGRSAAAYTGVSTAILATPGSAFESLAVFGKGVRSGRLHNAIMGGITEGPAQELPQGSAEQYIQNLQRIQAGEKISSGKGVLEAGVQGAIIGTPIGGALGAITGSGKPPAEIPASDVDMAFVAQHKTNLEAGMEPHEAYMGAAIPVLAQAPEGVEFTVYDSTGKEYAAQLVGRQDGTPLIQVDGAEKDRNYVLGDEFTITNPLNEAVTTSDGIPVSSLSGEALTNKVEEVHAKVFANEEAFKQSGVYPPQFHIDYRDLTALITREAQEKIPLTDKQKVQEQKDFNKQKREVVKSAKKPAPPVAEEPPPVAPVVPVEVDPIAEVAPPEAPVAPPVPKTQEEELQDQVDEETPTLPAELAKATPRFNVGTKSAIPTFASDVDKAAFIVSGKGESARHQDYFDWVMNATGLTKEQVIDHGNQVRREIKDSMEDVGKDGTLYIPEMELFNNPHDRAIGELSNLSLGDLRKSEVTAFANRLVKQGLVKEADLSDVREILKDKDQVADDAVGELESIIESSKPAKFSKTTKGKAKEKSTTTAAETVAKRRETTKQERVNRAIPRIAKLVEARLAKIGLGKYIDPVVLEAAIGDESKGISGAWTHLITLAINGKSDKQIMSTLDHESIHAMREIGMITPEEWKNLTAVAKAKDWITLFNIESRYDSQRPKMAYDSKDPAVVKKYEEFEDLKYEEAIADAWSTYTTGRSPIVGYLDKEFTRPQYIYKAELKLGGQPVGILTRIKKILGIIKDVAAEEKLGEDIFKRIEEAPIAATKPVQGAAPAKLSVTNREALGRSPEEADKAFRATQSAQRYGTNINGGVPEDIGVTFKYGGVMQQALEDAGDLVHRAAQPAEGGGEGTGGGGHDYGISALREKVGRLLRRFNGLVEDGEAQMERNAAYYEKEGDGLAADTLAKAYDTLEKYSDAYRQIPVTTKLQELGRDAAVLLGKRKWYEFKRKLEAMQEILDAPNVKEQFAGMAADNTPVIKLSELPTPKTAKLSASKKEANADLEKLRSEKLYVDKNGDQSNDQILLKHLRTSEPLETYNGKAISEYTIINKDDPTFKLGGVEMEVDNLGRPIRLHTIYIGQFIQFDKDEESPQHKGWGTKVIRALTASTREGVLIVENTIPRAVPFYEKLGAIWLGAKNNGNAYVSGQKLAEVGRESANRRRDEKYALARDAEKNDGKNNGEDQGKLSVARKEPTEEQKATARVKASAKAEANLNSTSIFSSKYGNDVDTVKDITPNKLQNLHRRATAIINTDASKAFFKSLGAHEIKAIPISGMWMGEAESSFMLTAKDEKGDSLPFEKMRGLSNILAWAFQQDAAITSEAIAKPQDTKDLIPSLYFGKGDKENLTPSEIAATFKTLTALGIDGASVTPDNKAVKLLYFGDEIDFNKWTSDVLEKVSEHGIKAYHVGYTYSTLDTTLRKTKNGNDSETNKRRGSEAWDTDVTGGSSVLFGRATDTFLVPYLLSVQAEGGRFDFDRWQSINKATKTERVALEQKVLAYQTIVEEAGLSPEEAASVNLLIGRTGLTGSDTFAIGKMGGIPEIVRYLDTKRKESGLRILDTTKEEDRVTLAKLMSAEALAAMRGAVQAIDWYDADIQKTLDILSVKYNELKTSPQARLAMRMAMAISSQTLNVEDNFRFAIKQYEHYRKFKEFPEEGTGKSLAPMAGNFATANRLLRILGIDGLHKFLVSDFTVKELGSMGIKVGGELQQTKLLGSVTFGPKIGYGFLSNLLGNFEPTTFDMWFMRTIGRLTGQLPVFKQDLFEAQMEKFRAALDERGTNGVFADKFDLDLRNAAKRDDAKVKELVDKIVSAHEKDYIERRKEYDKKYGTPTRFKSPLVSAAFAIKKSLEKPRDAPSTGTERNNLRDVMTKFVANVTKLNDGVRVPPAALQALIWHPEQQLYESLGARLRVTGQSYSGAAEKILKEGKISSSEKNDIEEIATRPAVPGKKIAEIGKETPFTPTQKEDFLQKYKGKFNIQVKTSDDAEVIQDEENEQPSVEPKLSATPRYATAAFGGRTIPIAWQTPATSGLNDFIWKMQDKFIDLKTIIKALDATVGKVSDKLNAYLKEELFHGRVAKRTNDFQIKELRPLLAEMKKRNVEMADIEKYLHNRHAKERNDHVNKIGGMADGGSGIKTKDAQDYMRSLSSQDRANYEAIAKMVDKITADSRKMLVDTGLEDQKTVDAWNAAYKNYVPLNRVQDDDMDANSGRTGMGQGFSVIQKVQRALGSSQDVEHIIANIAALRERIIVKAEKNEIGKAIFGLAIDYPNSDIWLPVDPEFKKSPTQALNDLLSMGYTLVQAQNLAAEPMSRDIDPNTGQIIQRVNPQLRNADNVLHLMVNGKEKLVFFNKRNPTAVRLIKSLKNLDVDTMGVALGSVAKVTRYFAAINTQYNPIFGIINLLRDISTGMLNLTNTPLAGQQGKVFGNIAPAMAGIWEQLRAEAKGNTGTSKWALRFNEFELAGGPTGYRDMFATSGDRADALAAEFKQLSNGRIKVAGKVVFDALSDYNTAMENGVRLSAYAAARDKGMSIEQAASLAKNLTVNFNRKGDVTTQMGALYAFFNASVQGTARIAQTLAGPAGRKIIGGGLLLGSVQAMLLAANDFGDDEPPDFVKQKNLIIPTGDGKYITIPMPLGFNLIPNFSRVVTEVFLSGGKNIPKKLAGLLEATLDGLNPVGGGTFAQIISPTVTDPIIALTENKDAFGRRIAKTDISGLTPTPGYLRTKETATIWSKELSKFLNYASGGTEAKKGLFSPTPDQIDYLIGQGTGGIGREISKASQSLGTLYTGEELASYKIPLVSRFYGDTKESASEANKFYTNITRINEHGLEIKHYRTHPGSGNIGEYIKENPEARLVGMASHTAQMLQNINAQKKKALERDLPKERIKQLEDLAKLHMKRFNDRVEALQ